MIDGAEFNNPKKSIKRKNQAKMAKSKNLLKPKNYNFSPNFKNIEAGPSFFTFKSRLVFTKLRQAVIEALTLYHLDLKCHIRIEIDTSRYVISRIQS